MSGEDKGTSPVLKIEDLHIRFAGRDEDAVNAVSLHVEAGEAVALVGESGSGKSATALAIMGLLPRSSRTSGSIRLASGTDVIGASEHVLEDLRGRVVSMVFQEPMTALNPTMTLGAQIAEAVRNHSAVSVRDAHARAVELMGAVGIPEPDRRSRQYPHELSGGQRQRVVIAIALACDPDVIIADEPTTALDVTVQAEILDLLRELVQEKGKGLLIITHNMGVVADLADRVYVMRRGEIVESGDVVQVLRSPTHPYTRGLLSSVLVVPPVRFDLWTDDHTSETAVGNAADAPSDAVIALSQVSAGYRVNGRHVPAVDGISLFVGQGEIVGLVGESGSGKSTIGRLALGLLTPAAGEVSLLGESLSRTRGRRKRGLLGGVGVVFQDPGGSLDPRMTVGDSIAEPLVIHERHFRARDRRARVAELLDAVKLPADAAARYPYEFSGGQRQRIGVARALARRPHLLVADEPTSALDVSVQAEVLQVLRDLHEELEFGCLFISHDLGVVNAMTDRVIVMQRGRIVEEGATADVLREPRAQYTWELLAAVPTADPIAQRERRLARHTLMTDSISRKR